MAAHQLDRDLGISKRRFPLGSEIGREGGVRFRVWAPLRNQVRVLLESGPGSAALIVLEPEPDDQGYHSAFSPQASAGTLYRFELDNDPSRYPDPASRYQPDGPHGPSQVIDSKSFVWTDQAWQGASREGQIIYEMHVGTFSREGSWQGAQHELNGIGRNRHYHDRGHARRRFPRPLRLGLRRRRDVCADLALRQPDDMRSFVNEAHAQGIAVILDVVYNHLGPDGNYLSAFSPWYFSSKHSNDWGDGINFDGEHCGPVREFFKANARYWIDEFHLDGLRLDATQEIHDDSPEHILREIAHCSRERRGKSQNCSDRGE